MLFVPLCGRALEWPMSYPGYNSFVPNYSNPSTPPEGFPWDTSVEHPDQAHTHGSNSASTPQETQAISPIVFQPLQQLSPTEATTPQDPQPPLHLQQVLQAAYEQPRTIHLQERVVPSQYRFDNIDESHFIDAEKQGASSCVGVDEMRSSTSPRSSGAVGPSRVPHGRTHTQPHPYRRQHSAASPSATASGTQAASARSVSSTTSRRASAQGDEPLLNERTSQLRAGSRGVPVSPAVGSGKAVSCPAMHVWRVNTTSANDSRDQQGQGATSGGPSGTATNSPAATGAISPMHTPAKHLAQLGTSQAPAQAPSQAKRFSIRTDLHFDATSNQMTAMLELPGLKKSDIRIIMNVCPYSRVRQLTISGRSRPCLPQGVYTVQERKFGDFSRVIPLPMDTKAEDVIAIMEDGILILKIPGGRPASREEPQEVSIY